ncbi:MAG: ABC transporter substrate-binding protein [Cyanosarcina radialis HA8281-LM2]|jgi:branched-chain amino acid transport system substrate-binding protein|nr:ABC transporter substrate-binding protein [Cyanosarcina radialis HA8281-LM2]
MIDINWSKNRRKKVIFEINDKGSFEQGFAVKLLIKDEDSGKLLAKTEGNLSPTIEILELYQQWQNHYLSWGKTYRWWGRQIEIPEEIITNISTIDECQSAAIALAKGLNKWLKQSDLNKIEHTLLMTVNPTDLVAVESVRFILQTQRIELQRLPWHEWHFLQENYSNAEMALSISEIPHKQLPTRQVRVLAILGSDENIDIVTDLNSLNKHLKQVEIDVIRNEHDAPLTRSKLKNKLRNLVQKQNLDVIFFAGHSSSTFSEESLDIHQVSTDLPVKIWISKEEYFSPLDEGFKNIFKQAVKKGLKLAIFNSCDGLGLARQLADLQIPHMVVFKEPVHDKVAQAFLEEFLQKFATGSPLHLAVNESRQWLQDELEENSPGASYLPAVFVNPEEPPFTLKRFSMPKIPPIVYVVLGVTALGLGWNLVSHPKKNSALPGVMVSACDRPGEQDNPYFSCGENILLKDPNKQPLDEKKNGTAAFARGDYKGAINFLQQAWNKEKDPETLIYLNNARIANEKNVRTIAVAIPASNTPILVPTSLLKGVADRQDNWNNNKENPWKLRVTIVDDGNDEIQGQEVAQEIVKRTEILVVQGHYSSQVTIPNKDIYQQNKVVSISSTATAAQLTSGGNDNFFLRVGSVNRYAGDDVADYVAKNHKKIAIFYTPEDPFSKSITGELETHLKGGVVIVKKFNLSQHPAQAKSEIEQARKLGATALIVFPGAYTARYEQDHVLKLVEQNNGQQVIIGNEAIYDSHLLKLGLPALSKMVITIPWHPLDNKNKNPQLLSKVPDWWGSKSNLNWRIILSADATKVILTALSNSEPDRVKIQQVLVNPNFKTEGITGDIGFDGSSDRQQRINVLVQPDCDLESKTCSGVKPISNN